MIGVSSGLSWGKAKPSDAQVGSGWSTLTPLDPQAVLHWAVTKPADSNLSGLWGLTAAADLLVKARHQAAVPGGVHTGSPWGSTTPADAFTMVRWDKSIKPVETHLRLLYNPMPGRPGLEIASGFYRVDEYLTRPNAATLLEDSLYYPGASAALSFSFKGRGYNPESAPFVYFDFRYLTPEDRTYATDSSGSGLSWGKAEQPGLSFRTPWGQATPTDGILLTIKYPDYTGPVVIPEDQIPKDPEILEAYMIGNLVTVTELVSGQPIDARSITLAWNHSSFSWSLGMDVMNRSSMNLIRPGAGGQKQVIIDINGWTWVMLVEKYRRNFKFPTEAYSVSGSSRVQLLAEPHATPASGVNALDISARQVMDSLTEYTGFSIQWSTTNEGDVPDWVIPAGALSYTEQTPLQLIARVAEAAGAIVKPGRAGDTISIIPRYLVPTWEWSPQTCHVILPAALLTNLGGDWSPQTSWNSCYVSGVNYGVGVLVTRAGTAGDKLAPDVLDELMTDSTAAAYRGKVELSKGGDKEIVTLQLPLFSPTNLNAPGLVEPGMLCDVREEEDPWVGLCLATTINCSGVGASLVSQTLQLERHTSEIV